MTTKHKPATPLPWHTVKDKAAPYSGIYGEMRQVIHENGATTDSDAAYIAHAANAYPKHIGRHVATLAAIGKVDDELQQMGHYALGKILRGEMSAIQALLHELGEDA